MIGSIYEDISFFSFIDEENNKDKKSVNIESKINVNNENVNVGDIVEVEYEGSTYIGKVVYTYYEGNAINVVFDHKHTTFHKSHVKKLS